MTSYEYNEAKNIATLTVGGNILKMTLTLEESAVVEKIFENSSNPFEEIKNFYKNIRNIETPKAAASIEETTLQKMVRVGFFEEDAQFPNVIYRNKLKLSLPQSLVDAYVEAWEQNDENIINTLDKFWYRMYLCPVDYARQDAFLFLKRGGFRILPNGLFLAGRNIVPRKNEYFELINQWVDKVKNVWKQKLSNVEVYLSNGQYVLYDITNKNKPNGQFVGNLQTLNDEKPEQIYTDGYTRTFKIKMGEPVFQSRIDCDHNRDNTCSEGLHFASIDKLNESSYGSYFGQTHILVAIDPMDLVAVPPADGYWKGRCCRYLPICEVERNENGNLIIPDLSLYQEMLDKYAGNTIYELQLKAESASPSEVEINFLEMPPQIIETADLYERLAKMTHTQSTPTKNECDDDDKWGDDDWDYEEDWYYDDDWNYDNGY